MSEHVTCPSCEGRGTEVCCVKTTGPQVYGFRHLDCLTCRGSGVITQEHLAAREAGHKLRDDRLKRNMTIRDEAARLGITMVELCDRERGYSATRDATEK